MERRAGGGLVEGKPRVNEESETRRENEGEKNEAWSRYAGWSGVVVDEGFVLKGESVTRG